MLTLVVVIKIFYDSRLGEILLEHEINLWCIFFLHVVHVYFTSVINLLSKVQINTFVYKTYFYQISYRLALSIQCRLSSLVNFSHIRTLVLSMKFISFF